MTLWVSWMPLDSVCLKSWTTTFGWQQAGERDPSTVPLFHPFYFFPRKQAVLFQMSWNVLFFDFRLIRSTSWHRCEACDGDFGFDIIRRMVWGDDVHRGELALVSNRGGGFLWNSSSEKPQIPSHCMNFMASSSFQQEKMSKAV